MFKFGRAALYERIIQEKVRQIDILAEQIEYLRAQLATRGIHVPGAAVNPTGQPDWGAPSALPLVEVKNHVSDDELDAEAIQASEGLSEEQMKEVIEGLGLVHEFDLDNIQFG